MRIFHIITHFDIGGAERVAVNIAKSQTTGMEYHLVEVVRGNGEFSQQGNRIKILDARSRMY